LLLRGLGLRMEATRYSRKPQKSSKRIELSGVICPSGLLFWSL